MTDDQASPAEIAAVNPRTGVADFTFAPASAAELASIAARLRAAQPAWRDAGLPARIAVMLRWADAIEAHAAAIGDAEEQDTGRRRVPHEVPFIVADAVRAWCRRAPAVVETALLGGVSSVTDQVTFATSLEPYPLVGMITPWNHPFLLSTLDAVPALLAGSAVIVKPSEHSPRFVDPVMDSIEAVPQLAAVFRYVRGAGETGQALITLVDALGFTGSVATGRAIALACSQRFIPAFLELGGKDPAVVTENADIDRATDSVLKGAVHNTGQICFATERIYVHESIHDEFVSMLVDKASKMRLNYPDIASGHIGPFILRRQADIVDAHLDDAVRRGAKIRVGGPSEHLGGGRYMNATVVTDVNHDMALMREETFGPVMPVMRYRSEDEAVALANDSEFGLSAAVIAGSRDEAERIAQRIDAGAISIQDTSLTPFIMGDVEKTAFASSGMGGSRMGPNGLLRFYRKRALIAREGAPSTMDDLAEDGYLPR